MTYPFKKNLPKIKCRICKSKFKPKRINSAMCSSVCRSIDRRLKQVERCERLSAAHRAKIKKKKCRVCCKLFFPIPSQRVTCSHKCSLIYNSRPRKRKKRKLSNTFSDFTLQNKHDKSEKKDIVRKRIITATEEFLKKGGLIQTLEPLPPPKIPSVGSTEWSWEIKAGVGPFYGMDELVEPGYILDEIISNRN